MGDSLGVSLRCSSPRSDPILCSADGASSTNGWSFGDADIPNGIGNPNGCDHLAAENVPTALHQNGHRGVSNGFDDAVRLVENGGTSHRHSMRYLWRAEVNAGSRREGCQGNTTTKSEQSHSEQFDSELASENVVRNASHQNGDQGVSNHANDAAQLVDNGGHSTSSVRRAEVHAASRRDGCEGNTTKTKQFHSELTSENENPLNASCQYADQGVSNGVNDPAKLVENGASSHRHSTSYARRVEVHGGLRREGCEDNTTKMNGKSHSEQFDSGHGGHAYEGDDTDVDRGHHDGDNDHARNDEVLSCMEGCVTTLLQGLGEDVEREGLVRTPRRVAKAFQFFTEGYGQTAKDVIGTALFHEEDAVPVSAEGDGYRGCAGVVVVRDIDLSSICIGCLSPVRFRCHIGYVPSKHRIVGLSKLPRIGEMCARRLQSPWRMADNFVESVHSVVPSRGVGVVVETWHPLSPGSLPLSSFSERRLPNHILDVDGDASGAPMLDEEGGLEPGMWVRHVEGAARGILQHEEGHWDEFLASLQMDNLSELVRVRSDSWLQKERRSIDSCDCWCRLGCQRNGGEAAHVTAGFLPQEVAGERRRVDLDLVGDWAWEDVCATSASEPRADTVPTMRLAVESLLCMAVKGNLPRNTIKITAHRYVQWLLWSTREGLRDEVEVSSWKSLGPLVDSCVNGAATATSGNHNGWLKNKNEDSSVGDVVGNCTRRQPLSGKPDFAAHDANSPSLKEKRSNDVAGSLTEIVPVPVLFPHTMASELCLPFSSLCEHHLLPFYGQVHVAYIYRSSLSRQRSDWEQEEQEGVVDRFFLKQIVSAYSRRLQVQERLGRQVARTLVSLFDLLGVMVVVEANHLCMMARGVKQVCSNTFSTAMLGCFSTSPKLRSEFLRKLPKKSISRYPTNAIVQRNAWNRRVVHSGSSMCENKIEN